MVLPQSVAFPEQFALTRVSAKGQTVIPRGIRRLLDIGPGSRLRWEVQGQVILVHPVSQDPLGASIGMLEGLGLGLPDFLEGRRNNA